MLKRAGPIVYYTFAALEKLDFLTHALSTRKSGISPFPSGALNLSYLPQDTPENVEHNRADFLAAIGQADATLVTLHQIHSSQIHILNNTALKTKPFLAAPERVDGDGLVTDEPGYLLGIQTADCLPIFLVDPERRAIANLHAGWRGTRSRIVQHGIERMQQTFDSRPDRLIAAIGPGIGVCCYEVGDEVVEEFRREFPNAGEWFRAPSGTRRRRLDLAAANTRQLLEMGLPERQILQAGRCTACEPEWFFSHRREKGVTGRMLAAIGLKLSVEDRARL